jgi:protein-L-isoaspartate(D-aspartate) O-methyltransferase
MTEQLQLQKGHKVLEIGTGSGYQAAVLSRLCAHVLTIERYRTLADTARDRLEALGYYNIEVMYGDGFDVPPAPAISTASSSPLRWSKFPKSCRQRLAAGGILIARSARITAPRRWSG